MKTTRVSMGDGAAVTRFGYTDGEIIVRFTREGLEVVGPFVGKPPGRLVFGEPSLDRLNGKYRASALVPVEHDGAQAYRLLLSPDANVPRAAAEYAAHPLVLSAEPNYAYTILRPAEAPDAVRTEVRPRER